MFHVVTKYPGTIYGFCCPIVAFTGFFQVIGKFSIRIVPNQTPEMVEKVTLAYLSKKWSERKTPNSLVMWCDGDRGWVGDTNNDNFQAGIRSVGSVLSGCVLFFCDGETEKQYCKGQRDILPPHYLLPA